MIAKISLAAFFLGLFTGSLRAAEPILVSSIAALAEAAEGNGRAIRMSPGVYRMADYLTPAVIEGISKGIDRSLPRPPVPMFVFRGSGNRIDLTDVTIEIDTSLYGKVPQRGYTRCLIVAGEGNTIGGLTLRNTGADTGSNGNLLSIAGTGNTLENITLHVHGSFPWGYGDLLGKGGPNLVALQKQSGIQVLGSRTILRRCKVFSRAFGHCYYIQAGDDIRIEDCHAEGVVRSTTDMLADTSGPAFDLGFAAVYQNRDGRFQITPGYVKALGEDGFRTYSTAGNVTLVNCTAVHTRAGFEIGARDDSPKRTWIENCQATGCERGFLLGSNVTVRRSRGNIIHGPLLYLRGGRGSNIELELSGERGQGTVHAVATIAGAGHRVRISCQPHETGFPKVPVMLGFGIPRHAEMASPILPEGAVGITLESWLPGVPVITSGEAKDCRVDARGPVFQDAALRVEPVSQ